MRILCKAFISLFLVLILTIFLTWTFRTNIFAYYLSRSLNGAPVSVQNFTYEKNYFWVQGLVISTKPPQKNLLFSAKNTTVSTSLSALLKEKIIVEKMQISDIELQITLQKNGNTNWDEVLEITETSSPGSPYLIKELVARNLVVSVTDSTGKTVRYPVIEEMVFTNISNETGIPLEQVQKEIFRLLLRRIFQEFGIKAIENVLKHILPDPSSFPFFQS